MATLPLPHKDLGDDRLWQVWGCILEASQQVEGWIGPIDVRDKSSFKSKDFFPNLKAPIGPIKSALLLTEAMGLLEAENDLQQKFALTEAGRALASQGSAAAQRAFRAHLAELWFAKLGANSFDEFLRAVQQQRSDASQEEGKAAWSMLETFDLLSAEPTASAEPVEPGDAQPAPAPLSEALGTAREAEQAEPTQASAPAEQPQAAQREDDKPEQEAQQPTLPEKASPEQTQSREPVQPAIDPLPPIPSRGSRLKARPSLQQGAESDAPPEGAAPVLDMSASPLATMRRSAPSSDAASEQAEDHVRPTLRGRLRKEDLPETTAPNANRIGPSASKPSETTESPATPSAPRGGRLGPRGGRLGPRGGRLGPRAGLSHTPAPPPSANPPSDLPALPRRLSAPPPAPSAPERPQPPAASAGSLDSLRRVPLSNASANPAPNASRRGPIDNRPRGPRSAPSTPWSTAPKAPDEQATALLIIELRDGKRVEVTRAMIAEYEARGFSFEEAISKIKRQFLETGSPPDES